MLAKYPRTFFYSDPHFGHRNIIEYCTRPFRDSAHQTEELIARYNSVVTPEDEVRWLGDAFFTTKPEAAGIMRRLNGTKHILLGNHDKRTKAWYKDIGFETVQEGLVLFRRVALCHFPYIMEHEKDIRLAHLHPKFEPRLLLHGHTHSPERFRPYQLHVGVDAWDYAPVEFERLLREYAASL